MNHDIDRIFAVCRILILAEILIFLNILFTTMRCDFEKIKFNVKIGLSISTKKEIEPSLDSS